MELPSAKKNKSLKSVSRMLGIMVSGLFLSQIIATLQVYLSNISLLKKCRILWESGYLVVPNQQVMATLDQLSYAVAGGVFFTLSIGAGLTVLSFGLAWAWIRVFKRNRRFLLGAGLLNGILVIYINGSFFLPIASLYFIFIPAFIFYAAHRWLPPSYDADIKFFMVVHILLIAALALLWSSQFSKGIFSALRDNYLLTNPFGYKINTFYYDYTLYPAEVFKSLDQKMLKSVSVGPFNEEKTRIKIRRILRNHDYLPISGTSADMSVVQYKSVLIFTDALNNKMEIRTDEFFKQPGKMLSRFSRQCDRYEQFRSVTILFLLLGFPVLIYSLFFSLLFLLFHSVLDQKKAAVIVAFLTFIMGIRLLLPIYKARQIQVNEKNVGQFFASENRLERIAALQEMMAHKMDLADFPNFEASIRSPSIPEQYWAIRAMAYSRHPDAVQFVIPFLDSPHTNIVCQCYYALGKLRNKQVVPVVLSRINSSTDWYQQFYAYHALRRLSWKQTIPGTLD